MYLTMDTSVKSSLVNIYTVILDPPLNLWWMGTNHRHHKLILGDGNITDDYYSTPQI